MERITTLLLLSVFQLLPYGTYSQDRDSVSSTWRTEPGDFYKKYTPLDYLKMLKDDFKGKNKLKVSLAMPSPDNWVKEEQIDDLMKLIYSSDSTLSIMSGWSSYWSADKFSSVGREAQNLIECFRTKKSYPTKLNSYGPPDKPNGKELENWWANYKRRNRN